MKFLILPATIGHNMGEREKFASEKFADKVWGVREMDIMKRWKVCDRITRKDRRELSDLEQLVLKKIQGLQSGDNMKEAQGPRGSMLGIIEGLIGVDGKEYDCTAVIDSNRIEVVVEDTIQTESETPIRKYRTMLGKYVFNGKETICDLSCTGDQKYSWRRDYSDNDYPEKRLTIKESHQFMQEILSAQPKNVQKAPREKILYLSDLSFKVEP